MPKILILNGPPGSGKDTIAKLMANNSTTQVREFKAALFDIALATSGITREDWFRRYNDRLAKEKPWGKLGMLSQRQYLIKISEEWVKPVFGKDQFGLLAAASCQQPFSNELDIVFSDGGFTDEVRALCNTFGSDNVRLVRLHRDGFDFKGDSRNYIYPDFCESCDLHLVDGHPEEAAHMLLSYLRTIE